MAEGGRSMLSIEEIAELRTEEKDAILDAVLGMAFADQEAQPEEVRLIKRFAAHFTDEDVDEVIASYEPNLERVGRKIAHSDLGPSGRAMLVRGMALVAAASGDLDDRELSFYTQCLRAFGISKMKQKKIERAVSRSLYAELCLAALAQGHDLEADRAALTDARERLALEADVAERIEKHARIEHRLKLA